MLLVCIALLPFARALLAPYGFSNLLLVMIYSSGLAILAIIEYATYAISSEGARLGIYLVAPLKMATYLRARLTVFLIPVLFVGVTLSLAFSWWIGLSTIEAVQVVVITTLILIGYTTFIVWGSTWDVDLNLVSEGMMQVLMQEELPMTPRRLQLLGLSFLLIGVMFLLVWKLPVSLSMLVLVFVDGLVLILGWRFGSTQLRSLIS